MRRLRIVSTASLILPWSRESHPFVFDRPFPTSPIHRQLVPISASRLALLQEMTRARTKRAGGARGVRLLCSGIAAPSDPDVPDKQNAKPPDKRVSSSVQKRLEHHDAWNPYRSYLLESDAAWTDFVRRVEAANTGNNMTESASSASDVAQAPVNSWFDPFWEQIRLEATVALQREPEAGPKLYQSILLQPGLMEAVASVIANEIETELFPANALKSLFLEQLTIDDQASVRLDLQAAASRSPCVDATAMDALLFHNGFHALVCYRVGHRLWRADRTALAYYLQSAVSRKYAADIHPSCTLGMGTYLNVGGGVVIGETAVVGNDACILEGVTLGGTGKEAGDRHPKVGHGVVIQEGGTVLGNIRVGDGALITAKSIVTKPVPPLGIASGVPARIQGYRELTEREFDDDLQRHLARKYLEDWKARYGSKAIDQVPAA